MVRLYTYNEGMGGFQNSNNLTIKQQAYRIINVNGANVEIFPICAFYGLKFDVLGKHTCIDAMGGFPESNMSQKSNSTIIYSLVIL